MQTITSEKIPAIERLRWAFVGSDLLGSRDQAPDVTFSTWQRGESGFQVGHLPQVSSFLVCVVSRKRDIFKLIGNLNFFIETRRPQLGS